MEKERKLLNVGLNILKLIGVHPNQNASGLILAIFVCVLRVVHIFLGIKYIIYNRDDIIAVVEGLAAIATFLYATAKLLIIFFYRKELRFLLYGINKFWVQKDENIYKTYLKFCYFYKYLPLSTLGILFATVIITHKLPYPIYIPEFKFAFILLYFTELFENIFDLLYILGIDLLYIALSVIVKHQFILLSEGLGKFNDSVENAEYNFKIYIEHHNYLLKFTLKFIDTYKYGLLVQVLLSEYSFCVELFNLTERHGFREMATSVLYLTCIYMQLALFCFPADDISEAAEKVSFYLYSAEWYNTPLNFQKNLPMVINRSQKPLTFTAGGMISINREAFTNIFKSGLSFYTVIKNFKNN